MAERPHKNSNFNSTGCNFFLLNLTWSPYYQNWLNLNYGTKSKEKSRYKESSLQNTYFIINQC